MKRHSRLLCFSLLVALPACLMSAREPATQPVITSLGEDSTTPHPSTDAPSQAAAEKSKDESSSGPIFPDSAAQVAANDPAPPPASRPEPRADSKPSEHSFEMDSQGPSAGTSSSGDKKVDARRGGALGRMSVMSAREAPPPAKGPMLSPPRPVATPSDLGVPDGDTVEGGEFISAGINGLIDANQDALSTFAADVDTGSYSLARRYLLAGSLPPQQGVRVEEWVNAFRYGYADLAREHPFSIHMEGAPLSKNAHVVRIGIQGKRIAKAERDPIHLTFLVDVSGSMRPADRLPLAKQSLAMLVSELDERDSVSLVTYAGSTSVVLASTTVTDKHRARIFDAIESLGAGGGTAMGSGMELAYREATKALSHKGSSRVIVLSDGDANIGRTGHHEMLDSIKGYVSEGVTMSTIGFGTGNYRDHMMEQLADAGNGNYSYVGSLSDAKKIFVDNLTGTLQVIAKDTKIQVEMNPAIVAQYRLIGYENRDVRDQDFRNDKVDAGEIGAGHTVTALYEVVLKEDAVEGPIATVRVRYKQPKGTKATEVATTFAATELKGDVRQLTADGRFAVGVGLAAESFRGSPHMARLGLSLADAHALMSSAIEGEYAAERREIAGLIAPLSGGTGVAAR